MVERAQAGTTARLPLRHSLPYILATWRTWLPPALVVAIAIFAALHYVRSMGWIRPVFDDSYISLQFARNLAEHGKLSFDGRHWSTGATSWLHVAVVAALIRAGIEPFSALIGFGVFCHALLGLAVYWLGWVLYRSRVAAFAGGALISVLNYAAYDAGNGMETTLFMALVAASFAAVLGLPGTRGRLIAGGFIALSVLTRPEGGLLIPAAAIYLALNRPAGARLEGMLREIALVAAPAIAVLVAETAFAIAVTGSLTPGTATVKLRFFQEYNESLTTRLRTAGDLIGLFAGPLAAPILFAAIEARRKECVLFGLFLAPLFVLYVLLFPGGLSHYFYRYQHPVLPVIAVLAGGGVAYLIATALRKDFLVKSLVVGSLVFLAVPVFKSFEYWHTLYRDSAYETFIDLEGMAQDLNKIVTPDQVLATHDIGAVGYFAHYKVLDIVGLVNPDVVKYHRGRHLDAFVATMRPDYLLILPDWDYMYLHLYPGSHPDMYELVKVYPGGPIRQQQPYLLYRVHYALTSSQ